MSVVMFFVGFIGWRGTEMTTRSMNEIYTGSVEDVVLLSSISYLFNDTIDDSTHKFHNKLISKETAEKNIQTALEVANRNWNDYLSHPLTAEQKRVADNIAKKLESSEKSIRKLLEIIKEDNHEALVDFIKTELYPAIEPLSSELKELMNLHLQKTRSQYEVALERYNAVTTITIISTIFGVLLGIILAIFIIRSITKPLQTALSVVNRMAIGDNSMQIEPVIKDEMGQLINAMKNMLESNKKMVDTLSAVTAGDLAINVTPRSSQDELGHTINNMIDKLRQMIADIQAESRVLGTSTQEIVSSVSQASSGTAETAAAVTETTSTIEEFRQTAHVAAENAKDVMARALDTVLTLKMCEQSLGTTVDSLHQIQDKGQVISDSIVKLGEQSLAIGEIISTVNDLAEQSNLLAVNAAIEAAKAGEQGKSFGVVAQEIRILAEQSKAATVQVRAILNDIQIATSAAVQAAHQGSKSVTNGVENSAQTSKSLQALSENISKVSQAAQLITVSSQQQLVAVDQVAVAMNNINDASNQHVDQMRQIETAVIALNEAGRSLRGLTDQYQLQRAPIKGIRRIDVSL
jgi:methyl-accepting chemotaxis protein